MLTYILINHNLLNYTNISIYFSNFKCILNNPHRLANTRKYCYTSLDGAIQTAIATRH